MLNEFNYTLGNVFEDLQDLSITEYKEGFPSVPFSTLFEGYTVDVKPYRSSYNTMMLFTCDKNRNVLFEIFLDRKSDGVTYNRVKLCLNDRLFRYAREDVKKDVKAFFESLGNVSYSYHNGWKNKHELDVFFEGSKKSTLTESQALYQALSLLRVVLATAYNENIIPSYVVELTEEEKQESLELFENVG